MKQEELKDLVYVLNYFKTNGIKIKTDGCGCCDSPAVKIEINDKLRVWEGGCFIDMFEENPISSIGLDDVSRFPEESIGDHQKREDEIKRQALIDGGYFNV